MTTNERLIKIATSDAATLARIDAILTGKAPAPKAEADYRLLTISEAAKKLGISRPTAYRLIEKGRLDIVLLDGVQRVPMHAVADFANGLK